MLLRGKSHYDICGTFECGQAFRFAAIDAETYRGVVGSTVLSVKKAPLGIEVFQHGLVLAEKDIRRFLDYDRDYESIQRELIQKVPQLKEAIDLSGGIRILRQAPFEILISFILSSNSNIKRIRTSVNQLCERYGRFIAEVDDKKYYEFPSLEQMKEISLEAYKQLGFGYRAAYVFSTVQTMGSVFELERASLMKTDDLHAYLMAFKGVGDKVARCVELFGFSRHEAFPIDIWIKRYFWRELHYESWTTKDMEIYAGQAFEAYAGLAQQYMFYFMLKKYKAIKT